MNILDIYRETCSYKWSCGKL